MKLQFTGFSMVLLAMLLLLPAAQAFPPAPNGVIYGLVKDQYGTPLMNSADTVILETPGGVQLTTAIQPNLAIGVNYALQVPMDAALTPMPYIATALPSGAQYKLYVDVNSVTNLPIEMEGPYMSLGLPAQQTLQNLTIGTDANDDGIPDAWESNFLASIGVNIALATINPNGIYTRDGRTLKQEYLLGNYPYNSNAFNVTIVSLKAGSATLAFTTTTGRTYTAYGSADLQNWTPLSFTVPAASIGAAASYYAAGVQPLQIQTVQPATAPQMQFFRLQLQ